MLSDFIAPGRLRAGDPQALAALVAVGGWPVVSYCERAGAGDGVARAVVLAFVTFRRRAIEAGDDASAELELLLLESARDAVDEVSGEAPAGEDAQAADDAFARARPRPLSPRLVTNILRALVEAAPVDGELLDVRANAERNYAEAYSAAPPAPAVAGEQQLAPASALLARAAAAGAPAPDADAGSEAARSAVPADEGASRAAASARADDGAGAPNAPNAPITAAPLPPLRRTRTPPPRSPQSALAPLASVVQFARARPAWLAAAAVAFVLIVLVLLTGDEQTQRSSTTVTRTTTVTVPGTATTAAQPAPAGGARQIVRGTPRKPLTANGGRFEIVPITDAAWAKKIRAAPRRTTYHWVTVAVRMRNLSRPDLALRGLGYRLRTRSGAIVGPLAIELTGARNGKVAIGSRASVHLGFEVGPDAGDLTFAFEPGGLEHPTVLVALGDGR